jgi:hypothetical protein
MKVAKRPSRSNAKADQNHDTFLIVMRGFSHRLPIRGSTAGYFVFAVRLCFAKFPTYLQVCPVLRGMQTRG